jgi:uncharacterized protein YaaR (DUF327 family)
MYCGYFYYIFGGVLKMLRGDVKGQRLFSQKPSQNQKTYKELYEEFIKILEYVDVQKKL